MAQTSQKKSMTGIANRFFIENSERRSEFSMENSEIARAPEAIMTLDLSPMCVMFVNK
jgi:hypothetical protein